MEQHGECGEEDGEGDKAGVYGAEEVEDEGAGGEPDGDAVRWELVEDNVAG